VGEIRAAQGRGRDVACQHRVCPEEGRGVEAGGLHVALDDVGFGLGREARRPACACIWVSGATLRAVADDAQRGSWHNCYMTDPTTNTYPYTLEVEPNPRSAGT
jgi:hypothetical protein